MPKKFDPAKPFRTRLKQEVTSFVLEDKICGVVKLSDDSAFFCEWSLDGQKRNLFPRNAGEHHDLDLVNYNGS